MIRDLNTKKTMKNAYRITKNKYDNGLATMTDLLDANAIKISSNVNFINAKADAVLAEIKLQETTGVLHLQ